MFNTDVSPSPLVAACWWLGANWLSAGCVVKNVQARVATTSMCRWRSPLTTGITLTHLMVPSPLCWPTRRGWGATTFFWAQVRAGFRRF